MHSGFVSIIGRPNAGKSTLLNALVGEKLAIVTPKPQTTRTRIQGILNLKAEKGGEHRASAVAARARSEGAAGEAVAEPSNKRPAAQIVFIDTPGVHRPDSRLNRKMTQEIQEALETRDLLLLIVDATERFGPQDQHVLDLIKKKTGPQAPSPASSQLISPAGDPSSDVSGLEQKGIYNKKIIRRSEAQPSSGAPPLSPVPCNLSPTFLLLNKIDRLPKEKLLPLIEHYRKLHDFQEIIPISATQRQGLDILLDKIVRALPQGPRYFPEDQLTDQPERFLAAEIIREKVLLKTSKEVPYAIAVVIDRYEELKKLTRIAATIYCERDGQKGILIGKRGERLKEIGSTARLELERLLGRKIFLELFVKVKHDWRDSASFVEELDWRREI